MEQDIAKDIIRLTPVRQKFLEAFAFDYDNDAKGYPCSPSWYKKYGDGARYISNQSGCQYDVHIKKNTGDSYTELTQIGDTINYYFEPEASLEYDYGKDYRFNLGTGKYKIIASIDYYNNGNNPENNWQSEKFDGTHDESTYDDNKMVRDLTGSESVPFRPTPVEHSQSGWFPPVAIIEIPGEPKEELRPVYGYRKVPLIKDKREVKKKVRLVE